MKIYSDTITRKDIFRTLHEALPDLAYADEFREFKPRKLATIQRERYQRGYELYLEALNGGQGTAHPRARNSRPGYALTWHEYGQWFALLFDIDPDAWISGWDGATNFHTRTRDQFQLGTADLLDPSC